MVVMGVTGCGKSTVGPILAAALGAEYLDGDRFHSPENIRKMGTGVPLGDGDRRPWLERIGSVLGSRTDRVVVGCSALKRRYRDMIRDVSGRRIVFIHLNGPRDVIAGRMAARDGHFMPVSLLESQFADLEPPGPEEVAIGIDVDQPLEGVVDEILEKLKGMGDDG